MENKNTFANIKKSTRHTLSLFFLLTLSNGFSQWKTDKANNIKNDVVISYDVVYDKELSADEKNSSEYISEITIAFNKDNMTERKFGSKLKPISSFGLFNYNTLKIYSCQVLGGSKRAIESDFKEPNIAVEPVADSNPKMFFDFPSEKGLVMVNNVPKDIYYTKKIGLRYCKQFKIDGFLMEYPGYSKTLGYYTVKAKKIVYDDLPDSFYSLEDYTILTKEELKKVQQESTEKANAARIQSIGKKAATFNQLTIKNEKIDTKKLSGDIIVYNFWFTTCGPCKAEIPKLNQLKEKYKDRNVHFIAIALDPEYKINPFLKMFPLEYDIIPEGRSLAEKFGVTGYPTNIIVDKKGIIQFFEIGYKADIEERMTATLDKYLDEQP